MENSICFIKKIFLNFRKFCMQNMFKVGNKHARVIYDTFSKLSIETQSNVIYFQFEQLSIVPAVSLLLTFNKYTALGILHFSIHQVYGSIYIISPSKNKCVSEHSRRSNQKMSAEKKTIEEKQTILLESMQCLR